MTKKFWKYKSVDDSLWTDWKWQMQNRLDNNSELKAYFPNISNKDFTHFKTYVQNYHFAITPFALSLIELDDRLNPVEVDPVWKQMKYLNQQEISHDGLENQTQNWEDPSEFPTEILHHKYPDRVIIRAVNKCLSYCNYCYLTWRIIHKNTPQSKSGFSRNWEDSIAYLRRNPQIHDVLISGGDPLILGNEKLERIFHDLSGINSIKTIRLNTRVLTYNPYRFDKELVLMFKKYNLNALEVQVSHPKEITSEFDAKLALFDEVGYRPFILWRAPLLANINNTENILKELFLKLYRRRILPYYLFHYAPYSLGRSVYGVPVKEGVSLLLKLRRGIPGPAFPRYTLFHMEGKHEIPLELKGTDTFIYEKDENGKPIIRFKNWKNKWVTYPDIEK